jgi:hypothetical protein
MYSEELNAFIDNTLRKIDNVQATIEDQSKAIKDQVNSIAEKSYNEGFGKGVLHAKNNSINEKVIDSTLIADIKNDAWDCLKRIVLDTDDGGLTGEELEQLFGVGNYFNILLDESITGEKAIDTVKAYLDKKVKDKEGVFDIGDLVVNGEKLYVVYRKYLQGSEYRYSIYNKDNIDDRWSNMSLKGFEIKARNIFG